MFSVTFTKGKKKLKEEYTIRRKEKEGKEKRRTAEAELDRIENELKQKLLEIR